MTQTAMVIRLSLTLLILSIYSIPVTEHEDPLHVWANNNSHKIETLELTDRHDDLNHLDNIVGDALLVCLGESRHDSREQFKLKHRFIKYFVEELGFTAFILEASLPYSELINEYIMGQGGDIETIMANMPGWFLWDTEEMTDIFNWMKDYNSKPEHIMKLRFYGNDIVAPEYGLTRIFDFLGKFDGKMLEKFNNVYFAQDIIDDSFWPSTWKKYAVLETEQKQLLKNNYKELYTQLLLNEEAFISGSSLEEYNWILRLAYCAKEANNMFSSDSRMDMGLIRDSAMAENILWIKNDLLNKEKMIVWAHNVHIAMGEFTMSVEEGSIKGMGYLLKKELGDKMVSIGAAFNKGEYPAWSRSFPPADSNTIEGALAQTGMEYLLLDLHGNTDDKQVKEWLSTDQMLRGHDFLMNCVLIESFDAIYSIDSISRTIPNQISAERFRNMN